MGKSSRRQRKRARIAETESVREISKEESSSDPVNRNRTESKERHHPQRKRAKPTLAGDNRAVPSTSSLPESSPGISNTKTVAKLEENPLQAANYYVPPEFPYPTLADDHCESPLEAYRDILPFLNYLSGEKPENVCVYDPYYCDGAVTNNLAKIGFHNVYHRKEDCYKVWSDPVSYPSFDIFVTNPPFSGDHIEKLMEHITAPSFRKPWFLLMPNFVHKKPFFLDACTKRNIQPFYLVPRKRYVYIPPVNYREAKKSDVHKKSSPFVTMWYIYGGSEAKTNEMIKLYFKQKMDSCDLARSKSALRDLRRKQR